MPTNTINIEIRAAVDDAVRKLGQVAKSGESLGSTFKRDAAGALGVFGVSLTSLNQPLTLVAGVIKDSIGKTMQYAAEVRGLARNIGITAEEASKLIQMGDDLGISTGTLQMGFKTLVQQGIQPNISNLQKLAAEYQAMTDPVDRGQFALKNFGRAGLEMTKILSQTPEQIKAMGQAAEEMGLILSQEDTQAAREFEMALDDLGDTMMGQVYLPIGKDLIPVLKSAGEAFALLLNWNKKLETGMAAHGQTVIQTTQTYEEYITEMLRARQASGLLSEGEANLIRNYRASAAANADNAEVMAGYTEQVNAALAAQKIETEEQYNASRVAAIVANARQGATAAVYSQEMATRAVGAAAREATLAEIAAREEMQKKEAEMLLKAALDKTLTDTQEKYNAAVNEERAAQLALTSATGISKAKKDELTAAYTTAVAKTQEEAAAMRELTAQYIYNQAAAGLDANAALELARSMGLVDESSYTTSKALMDLRDKYDVDKNGAISAGEAAAGYTREVKTLYDSIAALKDKNITITETHLKIEQHVPGEVYSTPKTAPAGATAPEYVPGRTGGNTGGYVPGQTGGRAAGGPVAAWQAYLVGEQGPELFVPNSSGRIINNTQTQNFVYNLTANYRHQSEISLRDSIRLLQMMRTA